MTKTTQRGSLALVLCALASTSLPGEALAARKLKVVTTLSTYASLAEYIGGDKVEVSYIVRGDQDAHIMRPKPSLAVRLKEADLLIDTGLDLEMWIPALQDMAGNRRIMSGQPGYVSVAAGIRMAEKPTSMDRSEGDVHAFGNPHIHTSPLNAKVIADNITAGLKRVAPEHAVYFDANLKRFKDEVDRRLFGDELVKILGSATLSRLAGNGQLIPFLSSKSYRGRPLIDSLGGWMKQGLPLRGRKIVTYHRSWVYFTDLFGLEVVGYMEPKPGIPPSPGHVSRLIESMRQAKVRVLLAENYFETGKIRLVADRTGAVPVIVSLGVGGQRGMDDYFDEIDIWLGGLLEAFRKAGEL